MKIIDESVLDLFRGPGPCECCGQWSFNREAHHAYLKKQMGSGQRIDAPENIASLAPLCHRKAEDDHAVNAKIQRIIAERIGQPTYRIFGWLHAVRNAPRDGPCPQRPWQADVPAFRGPHGNHHRHAAADPDLPDHAAGVGDREAGDPADQGWVEF